MATRLILIVGVTLCLTSCMHKSNLTILFDRVDGLEVGSKVYNKGIEIGDVTRIDLFGNKVLTEIRLNDKINIPISSAFIINQNLLGTTSINVDYSDKQQFLSSGDTSLGHYQGKKLLDNLVSDSSKRQQIQKSLDKIGEGISELVEAAKDTNNKTK